MRIYDAALVLGIDEKGKSMEKDLSSIHDKLPIIFSLNLSFLWN